MVDTETLLIIIPSTLFLFIAAFTVYIGVKSVPDRRQRRPRRQAPRIHIARSIPTPPPSFHDAVIASPPPAYSVTASPTNHHHFSESIASSTSSTTQRLEPMTDEEVANFLFTTTQSSVTITVQPATPPNEQH